jgi:hypothetical protein
MLILYCRVVDELYMFCVDIDLSLRISFVEQLSSIVAALHWVGMYCPSSLQSEMLLGNVVGSSSWDAVRVEGKVSERGVWRSWTSIVL